MFARWFAQDFARRQIIGCLATLITLPLFCVCIFIPLSIANSSSSDAALIPLIVGSLLFLAVLIGGSVGFVFFVLRRRGHQLDEVFAPLGMTGRSYNMTGRFYEGQVAGREVQALFQRGPLLTLYVSTPLQTRLTVAAKATTATGLGRALGYEPLPWDDTELVASGLDKGWCGRVLADPEIVNNFRQLTLQETGFWIQQVILSPGAISFRLYRNRNLFQYQMTAEQMQRWVALLIAILERMEQLPPAQVTAEASQIELEVRRGRVPRVAYIIIAVILGGIFLMAAFMVAFALLLVFLEG